MNLPPAKQLEMVDAELASASEKLYSLPPDVVEAAEVSASLMLLTVTDLIHHHGVLSVLRFSEGPNGRGNDFAIRKTSSGIRFGAAFVAPAVSERLSLFAEKILALASADLGAVFLRSSVPEVDPDSGLPVVEVRGWLSQDLRLLPRPSSQVEAAFMSGPWPELPAIQGSAIRFVGSSSAAL